MAKFHGSIGFVKLEETAPGVHSEVVTERPYKGDILRNSQRWEASDKINSNLTIESRFSVVADAYANENFPYIRYVLWNSIKWTIRSIEIQPPRLVLTVGGIHNG